MSRAHSYFASHFSDALYLSFQAASIGWAKQMPVIALDVSNGLRANFNSGQQRQLMNVFFCEISINPHDIHW